MRILFSIAFLLIAADYSQLSNARLIDSFALLVLALIVAVNANKVRKTLIKNKNILLFIALLFIVLLAISFFRTNLLKTGPVYNVIKALKLILAFGAALSFSVNIFEKGNRNSDKAFFRIITIPVLFVIINLLFKIISYDVLEFLKKYPDIGISNTLYAITGIEVKRLPFPLSSGVNTYGSFLGAMLVLTVSFFLVSKNKRLKFYCIVISIIYLGCLLVLDSRAVLIAFIVILIGTALIKSVKYLNLSRKVVWLLGLLPVVLVLTGFLLRNLEIFSFISRSGSNDVGSANNRNIIWAFCLQEILDFKFVHLVGFGEFGQVGSKISNLWAEDFSFYDNPIYTSAHNTTFQLFLDIGYIGVFVYYALLIIGSNYIYKMYKQTGDSNLIIFQNFLLYISFIGGSEAINTHTATYYLFIVIIGSLVIYNMRNRTVNNTV